MTSETTPDQQPAAPKLAFLRSATVVAVGMAIMNVAAYGFTLIAVHRLVPEQFGAVTALLGLLLIGNVASLGLQASGARRIATHTGPGEAALADSMLKAGRRAAVGLTLICLLATPLIMWLLHIDSLVAALMVAPTLGFLTVMGSQLGVLQGGKNWTELAAVYLSTGIGRLVFGGGALFVHQSVTAAMIGLAIGAAVPALLGTFLLRGSVGGTIEQVKEVLGETVHGTHTLLAFFVIANADVLLARNLLDPKHSGYYAAGVIVAKACLFLPQFVIVVVFPSLASSPGDTLRLRRAIQAVAALGVCTVLGALVLPDLVVTVVGGPEDYAPVGPVAWLFALAGSSYAVLQLVVYAAIAQQEKRAALLIWIGLISLAVATLIILGADIATGMTGVKVLVAMTSTCAIALSVALASGLHRQAAAEETARS
ncbi:polysaccharide biosynthesis protein [Kribbella flavida DSM 17836]|uniref:Polysaccharide biosynthesis protein n=1 Tax=Kribbella flavida (strain DSM 17836 / JCM 10339 / NBRC 14399) TaxID=479435 RepID=D2Q330_KRIFD|nr:polysaccharide biosynthesis protein [Kribbella flavida]ADB32155.1 polysaccharide biosynthesis protein [Kribbella flavida DSM 17836]